MLEKSILLSKNINSNLIPMLVFKSLFLNNSSFYSRVKKEFRGLSTFFYFNTSLNKKNLKKKKMNANIQKHFQYNSFLSKYYLFNNISYVSFHRKKKMSIYYFLKKLNFFNHNIDVQFNIYNSDYYL